MLALRRDKHWLSTFELINLCAGAGTELGLHSDTISEICREYVTRRIQFKKRRLKWRSRKHSLGWIPFKARFLKIEGDTIKYLKRRFRFWLSRAIVDGVAYKTKLPTLRGDYQKPDGTIGNHLRLWEKLDFIPQPDDLLQERLYCIQWMQPKTQGRGEEYEFRSITEDELLRDRIVQDYVAQHLADWQRRGWTPDMRIEVGGPPRYQGLDLIRARGWTYWHHLFNPRQLLLAGLANQFSDARLKFGLTQLLNNCSRLTRWRPQAGGGGGTAGVFDNQALNTLFNYACRATGSAANLLTTEHKHFAVKLSVKEEVHCLPADQLNTENDI